MNKEEYLSGNEVYLVEFFVFVPMLVVGRKGSSGALLLFAIVGKVGLSGSSNEVGGRRQRVTSVAYLSSSLTPTDCKWLKGSGSAIG